MVTISLANIHYHISLSKNFKIYSLNNFQIQTRVLLAVVTVLRPPSQDRVILSLDAGSNSSLAQTAFSYLTCSVYGLSSASLITCHPQINTRNLTVSVTLGLQLAFR